MEIDISGILHSTWLLPVMGALSWALVKYLGDRFTTTQTFDNYVKAVDKKYDDLKEEMEESFVGVKDNDRDLYEKNRVLGLEVAEIKGKLEK